ncbi:MAG TPA: FAD-dependent oxidoreductase [Kineosporiaceae bacterium]|nr:FAD-dependent oxidoreductase [Kineosporiaceae bacterium]
MDADPAGRAVVQGYNDGRAIIPTIVFDDGGVLVEPSNAELAEKLGLRTTAKNAFYDLIVVGSGPAGSTAALYGAREGLAVLVIERSGVGGQAGVTGRLDNVPGFPADVRAHRVEGLGQVPSGDTVPRRVEPRRVLPASVRVVVSSRRRRHFSSNRRRSDGSRRRSSRMMLPSVL